MKNDDIVEISKKLSDFSKKFKINEFINSNLTKIESTDYFFPPHSSITKYRILDSSKYELSLISLQNIKGNKFLYSYNSDVLLCPIYLKENIVYNIFEQNKNIKYNLLDISSKLKLIKTDVLKNNTTILIKKFYNIFSIDKINPILFISLSKKDSCDFIWEYDINTLKPIRIISTNIQNNRLVTTLKILSEIGNKESIPFVNNCLNNENHVLRWEAVKTLINIDFDKGVNELNKMTTDKHNEIKEASINSLKQLID